MPTLLGTPQMDPPQNQFFEWFKLGCQCFIVSADIWVTIILHCGGTSPRTPLPQITPPNSIFRMAKAERLFLVLLNMKQIF